MKARNMRRQRGLALMELLLLTVPLSLLAIVLASAIAATATAKNRAMWKASLKAQLATREPCGGLPLYALPGTVPVSSPKQGQFNQGRGQAAEIGLIGAPITMTNNKTERVTEPVAPFYFEKTADRMFPARTREAENAATFTCNEPNDGDSRRGRYEAVLFARALAKARELF